MCGLVGLFNKNRNGFTRDQQEVFSSLLFIDYLRGPDSTGSFLITNTGDLHLAKEAEDSLRFMRSKEYDDLMSKAWNCGSAMIGHNRKATRGVVNDENAHPFVVDDKIVLVHNGTMYGDHKKLANVEVDSHAIAHMIHEKGSVAEALGSFDAAYALIWYDVEKETVNLIRNSQRPLWWMETGNSWIWSSEKAMLEFVAGRHNLTVKEGPHELPEDTLQTYSLKNNTWEVTANKIDIKKKSYNNNNSVAVSNHRPHPYANAYMEPDYERGRGRFHNLDGDPWENDSIPFADVPDLPMARPAPRQAVEDVAEKYSQSEPPGTTGYFEREMARKMNLIITRDEWQQDIVRNADYQWGKEVVAEGFEYNYANTKDSLGGYHLYCRVVDDPTILVRQWFDSKNLKEEQIIEMASGYVYKFKIGQKRWSAIAPGAVVGRSAGFVMIIPDKCTLVYGGGVGDQTYAKQKVH